MDIDKSERERIMPNLARELGVLVGNNYNVCVHIQGALN